MIDELGLWRVVNKRAHLKFKFEGVYSADNFPVMLRENIFVIVNSDNSEKYGTHWLLYCKRQNGYCFGDPLGVYLFNLTRTFPVVWTRLISEERKSLIINFRNLHLTFADPTV